MIRHLKKIVPIKVFFVLLLLGVWGRTSIVAQNTTNILPVLPSHGEGNDQPAFVSTFVTQTIDLVAGWNYVSFNLEITMADLQAALQAAYPDAAANALTIKSKGDGQTAYNPFAHRWIGSLTTLDLSQMYKVKVPTAGEIEVQGSPIDPAAHPATIKYGANWIAFPLDTNMTVTEAFAGFPTNGDIIKIKDGGQAQWNQMANRWIGTLTTLVPGKGYIYNSKASADKPFTFPSAK